MPLEAGDKLGPYVILAPLGAAQTLFDIPPIFSPVITVVLNWQTGIKR